MQAHTCSLHSSTTYTIGGTIQVAPRLRLLSHPHPLSTYLSQTLYRIIRVAVRLFLLRSHPLSTYLSQTQDARILSTITERTGSIFTPYVT
jgi:hypothetical protein